MRIVPSPKPEKNVRMATTKAAADIIIISISKFVNGQIYKKCGKLHKNKSHLGLCFINKHSHLALVFIVYYKEVSRYARNDNGGLGIRACCKPPFFRGSRHSERSEEALTLWYFQSFIGRVRGFYHSFVAH